MIRLKKGLSIVAAVVVVVVCLSITTFAVENKGAANDRKVVTSVKPVRLYRTKNYSKTNHITDYADGYLPAGSCVEILSLSEGASTATADRTWVTIKYSNPQNDEETHTAYACVKDGREVFKDIVFYDGHKYEKTLMRSNRNLRAGTSNDSQKLASAVKGTEVLIEGIETSTSSGKWMAVKYMDNGTAKDGYIFQATGLQYFDKYVLDANGNRRAYAQGTNHKNIYGDKVPVYETKTKQNGAAKMLAFGEEVYVLETVLVGKQTDDYWWKIQYKDANHVTRTGYLYQYHAAAPVLTYSNVNAYSQNLSQRQLSIRSSALELYNKGKSLQYNNANRLLPGGENNSSAIDEACAAAVNTLYALPANSNTNQKNIDCSSFAYSVFLHSQNIKLERKTKTLMKYARENKTNTSVVKAYLNKSEFEEYYNSDTLTVDTKRLANDYGLKVGDLVVTRSNLDTDHPNGHVMIVYAVQYDGAGNPDNFVLIHSTGNNNDTEVYGSVQFISMSARFIGARHTTDLDEFAIIKPTADMR